MSNVLRPMFVSAAVAISMVASSCGASPLPSSGAATTSPDRTSQTTGPSADESGQMLDASAVGSSDSGFAPGSGDPAADSASDTAFGQPLAPAQTPVERAAALRQEVRPVALTIDRLGLNDTPIRTVGTLANGEMEVPPPLEVGWYQYGPEPGDPGSAVLAGHVASGGIDGAFRHLDRLQPGDSIVVHNSDGIALEFVVVERFQVAKTELPFDELFARSGESMLALITCGGEFNPRERSYRDNIAVTARLVTG